MMKPWKSNKTKTTKSKWSNNTPSKKTKEKTRTKPWAKRPDGSLIIADYHDIEAW